jgi:hypothetical protein
MLLALQGANTLLLCSGKNLVFWSMYSPIPDLKRGIHIGNACDEDLCLGMQYYELLKISSDVSGLRIIHI